MTVEDDLMLKFNNKTDSLVDALPDFITAAVKRYLKVVGCRTKLVEARIREGFTIVTWEDEWSGDEEEERSLRVWDVRAPGVDLYKGPVAECEWPSHWYSYDSIFEECENMIPAVRYDFDEKIANAVDDWLADEVADIVVAIEGEEVRLWL